MLTALITAMTLSLIGVAVVAYTKRRPHHVPAGERPSTAPQPSDQVGPSGTPPMAYVPPRMRWNKVVLFFGWIFVVGVAPGLLTFVLGLSEGRTDMTIAGAAMTVLLPGFGAALLVGYRNWYLEVWPDGVRFRKAFGNEGFIRYCDIDRFRLWTMQNGQSYSLQDVQGTRLSVNVSMYDASLLVAQLAHRVQYGFWATPQQLQQAMAAGVLQPPTHPAQGLAQPGFGLAGPSAQTEQR